MGSRVNTGENTLHSFIHERPVQSSTTRTTRAESHNNTTLQTTLQQRTYQRGRAARPAYHCSEWDDSGGINDCENPVLLV